MIPAYEKARANVQELRSILSEMNQTLREALKAYGSGTGFAEGGGASETNYCPMCGAELKYLETTGLHYAVCPNFDTEPPTCVFGTGGVDDMEVLWKLLRRRPWQ